MKRDFDLLMGEVERLHGELVASDPHKRTEIPKAFAYPGVYAFSEWGKFLYVGRSGNVRKRIWEQCQPGRKWNVPFAFLLAREVTNTWEPSYRPKGSRKHLMENKAFLAAFSEQIKRIGEMGVRLVRVDALVVQALLEIYTSAVLDTPYNEFRTTQARRGERII